MDPESPSSSEVVHDRYEVVRLLGRGALGRTFEVRDRQVDKDRLVLKLLEREGMEQKLLHDAVLRKATAAEEVAGDHVLRLRGNGVDEAGRLYLLREFVEGESLAARLQREDTLQPRQAVDIALQTLDGLQCIHEKGLIHGHLRPSDVLLKNAIPKNRANPFGIEVKVTGFGLPDPGELGEDGSLQNLYQAPDWTDEESVDVRASLFSVGMLLCEMLCGSRDFCSGGAQRLREAILAGDESRIVAQLRSMNPSVRRPLLVALSRKREDRFPGIRELQDALRASDVFAAEKMRAPVALVVAAMIAAVVGLTMAWRSGNQLEEERRTRFDQRAQAESRLPLQEQLTQLEKERDAALSHVRQLEAELEQRGAPAGAADGGEGAPTPNGTPPASAEAYAARGFDAFLDQVEAGRSGPRALLDALAPGGTPVPGAPLLDSVAAAANAVRALHGATGDGVRRYLARRARATLSDVQALRASFTSDAAVWLDHAPPGAQAPDRPGRLDGTLAALEGELAVVETALAELPPEPVDRKDEEWMRILAAGPGQDPREAFDLAALPDGGLDPRLFELTEKYRGGLENRLVHGVDLDREALASESRLAQWATLLEKSEDARSWPASRDIRLMGYARRFFVENDAGPFPWAEVYSPSGPVDWRRDFQLRARLVQEQPWFLQGADNRAVYVRRTGGATTFLRSEWVGPPATGGRRMSVSVYDDRGSRITRRELNVKRSGLAFEWDENRIDLARDAARVERYEPDESVSSVSVPRQAGVRSGDGQRFLEGVARLSVAERDCLVFEVDGRSFWISPDLGLVRVVEGAAVQELVFTTIPF